MLIARSRKTKEEKVVVYYKQTLEGKYYVNNIEYLGIFESLKNMEKLDYDRHKKSINKWW